MLLRYDLNMVLAGGFSIIECHKRVILIVNKHEIQHESQRLKKKILNTHFVYHVEAILGGHITKGTRL